MSLMRALSSDSHIIVLLQLCCPPTTYSSVAKKRSTLVLFRERVAFGKPLSQDSLVRHNVALSRMEIAQVRVGRVDRLRRCGDPLILPHI